MANELSRQMSQRRTPFHVGMDENVYAEQNQECLYDFISQQTTAQTAPIRQAPIRRAPVRHGTLGFIATAVFLLLLGVAYGISNLLLEVSLSFSNGEWNGSAMINEEKNSNNRIVVRLKLVTMNIAGMEPSQSAPDSWNKEQQRAALIEEILRSDPDIIALQEAPSDVLSSGMFDHDDRTFRQLHSVPSHAGYVTLFVRSEMETGALNLGNKVPIVASFLFCERLNLVIASAHLAPFEQRSYQRQKEVDTLIHVARDSNAGPVDAIIFLGDTNMRSFEDQTMEGDLGLIDAWKQAGSSPEARYTWDTTPHGEGESAWQNLYYGQRTRAYQNRYDRVYIKDLRRGSASSFSSFPLHVNVSAFDLIANKPVSESQYHFLSDHFGIATELELSWI